MAQIGEVKSVAVAYIGKLENHMSNGGNRTFYFLDFILI